MESRKKKVCAAALAGAVALSALGIGYSAWKTEITAGGNVAASGKWQVVVTDADMKLSTGTSLDEITVKSYKMERTNVKGDSLIASVISASEWLPEGSDDKIGTQSDEEMSKYTYYYAVDQTKHDLSTLTTLTTDQRNEIVNDDTTVTISDEFKMYYRNILPTSAWTSESSIASATKVVDGLIRDTEGLLKEKFPSTYQNYVIVSMGTSLPKSNHTIAEFKETESSAEPSEEDMAVISEDGTSVTFANATFGLPGAWAQYSMTVKNNGTVNASLSDAVIELETDAEDQLKLSKPDLEDEVLAPGESCTITFVVQVPEEVTEDLNAAGTLTVKLPYAQGAVEAAPEAGHTHTN